MADEALSVTDAIGLLDAAPPPEPEEQPAPEAQEPDAEEIEAQPSAEDADDPEEAIEGEPEPDGEDEAQPQLTKPRSWAAEDEETWNGIPRAAQEKILARETERDAATDRALQQAADARREAEGHIQTAAQIKASLDAALPEAQRVFQSRWSNWTPQYQAELARTNAAEYTALTAQYNAEQSELARMDGIRKSAEALTFQEFVRTEGERLTTLSPDLADPKEGPARKQQLATFLTQTGVPEDQISKLDANAIALAYDAMRWRQAQGRIAQPKPPAPAPARTVRPAAAAQVRTPQREAQEAKNRFVQTRSVEDAVRLLGSR